MDLELLATWIGLCITASAGVFFMGKQSQKIDDLQDQLDNQDKRLDKVQEWPVKLATLETDMKYLIREITDLKQQLLHKG